ncbi:conserved hypothetical protein [Altererythrobacter sp. B11]|uniref:TadE/TadG family type IV pilus assembly protein n=1 Tax=Altererythrobacter sp. B11 TaxID=2060312 RepID=UPI000DC6DBF1|nr:TadE family protein [Altererythrobacter sp. B11]BBC73062.1 conserved hypothetical protein [Altererythrobacter sp. B11]
MIRRLRHLRADQQGTTLVEFAFVAPVFLLMLMGIFDLGHGIYIRAVLDGALQQAGRNSGLESGPENLAKIDQYVSDQVLALVPGGEMEFDRKNYWEFGDVGEAEDFIDANDNGVYDDDECFYDANDNDLWDDRGKAGQGSAKDVVLYTATVNYDHLFPLWRFLGGTQDTSITASTTLRNQPFGSQPGRKVEYMCP